LREASLRAARKPARGGVPNAMFVRAPAEALPEELTGLATRLTVLLPWGSLLDAVAHPDAGVLAGLRGLCAPGADLHIVMGYEAAEDPLSPDLLERVVVPAYRAAGFDATVAPVDRVELKALGTSWSARLAFGRDRRYWRLSGAAV